MAECPAKIDLNVLPLEKANFAEPALERCHVCRRVVWEPPAEETDHRRRRLLLRVRRERPRGRAAEQRDELAPCNVTCHAPPSETCPVKRYYIDIRSFASVACWPRYVRLGLR